MRPNRSPFRILPSRHSLRVMLAASLPFLALAATCDHAYSRHHTDEPTTFEGPQYGDTPPLNLNIASLSVVDRGSPGWCRATCRAARPARRTNCSNSWPMTGCWRPAAGDGRVHHRSRLHPA
ncbi:hypothetical protein RAA17_23035 [Komagataeibacter rhaeticus]|nr:hypothetical protein [Komagataeibacter rhaeticus]